MVYWKQSPRRPFRRGDLPPAVPNTLPGAFLLGLTQFASLTPPPAPSPNFGFLPAIPLEVGRIGNPTYLAAFAAQ